MAVASLFPSVKARSANGCKILLAGNDHAAAGRTMDDQQITVCIPAAYNTHMAVIGVKYQVTGLGLVPRD